MNKMECIAINAIKMLMKKTTIIFIIQSHRETNTFTGKRVYPPVGILMALLENRKYYKVS